MTSWYKATTLPLRQGFPSKIEINLDLKILNQVMILFSPLECGCLITKSI
jgi:hypothetical protein